jgi:hypothetical protein
MNQRDRETSWIKLARLSVLKFNAGWWLQALTPILIFVALAGFCVVFYLRSRFVEIPAAISVWSTLAVILGSCVVAWLIARKNFQSMEKGLVRLEARMKMRNALTAAQQGISTWPEPPIRAIDGVQWRWDRVLLPFVLAVAFLTVAFAWPFKRPESMDDLVIAKPPLWGQMERMLEEIEEEKIVEEEDTARVREQLEQLMNRPEDEWYSHNSMEATDALRKAVNANMQKLNSNLTTAQRAISAFQQFSDQMDNSTKQRLMDEYSKAVEGMETGALRANKGLRDALKGIDPSMLKQLSESQMKELQKKLSECQGACSSCLGDNLSEDEKELMRLIQGEGEGMSKIPGISRGPGHVPLPMSNEETDLGTRNFEGIEGNDFSRSIPADLIDITEREHEVDEEILGTRAAGAIKSTGDGGDAVWRSELLPDEKAVLERYFE